MRTLAQINEEIVACRRCPRLVAYLLEVGATKRKAFAGWDYWARPLPASGDPQARLVVVGLAPAAHGGTRTGRVFTGDSSSQFLFRALHAAGFASQPTSERRDDGLELRDAYITLAARCAPPENKPLPEELERCRPFLVAELRALARARVIVALGKIAFDAVLRAAPEAGMTLAARAKKRPQFGHGARVRLTRESSEIWLIGSYHPSQQNTSTGVLTKRMLDAIFRRAKSALEPNAAAGNLI